MQEFDPRQTTAVRFGPPVLAALGGLSVVVVGWQSLHRQPGAIGVPTAATPAAGHLAPQAVRAPIQARLAPPPVVSMMVKVAPGETLESAVRRTGVGQAEAQQAVRMLGKAFDTTNIKAGMAFQANIARPLGEQGSARLMALSLRLDALTAISLSRAIDGALHLQTQQEKVIEQTAVAAGRLDGSLYVSAQKAGATPELTAQVVKLFSHRLDFSRDIQRGDRFSMVYDRKVTQSGRTVSTGKLLFAEIKAKGGDTRFYRYKAPGMAEAEFFDEFGKNMRSLLLRTPLDSIRITSTFGMRMHPILGFTKMHTGIDFGAPAGTPVYAAGDGVVVKAEWAGGYGRWLQIKHANGVETGYGHLSGWAVSSGQHVHQGQVVAYVGSTGQSTGPHLHYETIINGQKVNPSAFKAPPSVVLSGAQLAAFKTEKARIDALVTHEVADVGGRHPGA